MSQNNDLDIGPLTWVKNEIDSALSAARDRLGELLANPDHREPLRFAQNHIHQAAGALSIVGLDGISQFADAIDKLLSTLSTGEAALPVAQIELVQRSVGVLGNYINEVSIGAPHQPLRLYPLYKELVSARGGEAPLPSELFFPDLSIRPSLASPESLVSPERAAHEVRVLRSHFEKGLLAWLRKPQDPSGPEEMLRVVRRIEQIQQIPTTRSFWWATAAFFEGLATQSVPADRQSQRLCRRIDAQVRRLLEGSQVVAERLIRDVLYFVAANQIATPHALAVRQAYQLDRMLPAPDTELSDTLRQPLVLRLRETLEQCKEYWNRFCGGTHAALPHFQEQLAELATRAEPLRLPLGSRLLDSLQKVSAWLRADPTRASEALSMEVATTLLVIEQAADSPNLDTALLRRQVDLLCAQFDARLRGEQPSQLDDQPFGQASRHAQERQFFNQLAREILANLGHIEQALDNFFRNPAQKDTLAALSGPLKQIEGAFAVLGESKAVDLVRNNSAAIANFVERETPPAQDEFDTIAQQLSALGFYVEALKNGPARLDDFLNPTRPAIAEEQQAQPDDTVEAQLQRETAQTNQLVAALKETPEDAQLRQQLVSNLEAIREDAQLVADSGLEKKAKEALASLKAGEVSQETLVDTLSTVAVASAPAPSQDAARMISANSEEVDAELLGIFLEEAHEVLETIQTNRQQVTRTSADKEALTTIRRGYHTLKGSSRMVGLIDFSDAARHVEMTMNRWLQLEKPADDSLLSLVDAGHATFGAWVTQLESNGGLWRDATALIAQADALLASLDPSADDVAPVAAPVVAAAPVAAIAPAPEPEPGEDESMELELLSLGDEAVIQPASEASLETTRLFMPQEHEDDSGAELDLTSTLLGSELFAFSSGESQATEVDLAATDFDGDTLRLFTAEIENLSNDEPVFSLPTETTPPVKTGGVDFELGAFDLDEELVAEPSSAGSGAALVETQAAPTPAAPAPEPEPEVVTIEAADDAAGDDHLSELDLTTTFLSGELDALVSGDTNLPGEIDLTSTDLEINVAENGDDDSDLEVLEVAAPAEPAAEEIKVAEAPAAADDALQAIRFEPVVSPSALQEIAIEDSDAEVDLPQISDILHREGLASEPAVSAPAPEAEAETETEVFIGDQSLSRGLYDLYVAEARQHIDHLVESHRKLEQNPTRIPTIESLRAAHTLAGISGTARIEPAYTLGKALEHALHRFTDGAVPPNSAQTHVLGDTIRALDEMLSEVLELQMPVEQPELIAQLGELHPVAVVEVAEVAEAPAAELAAPVADETDSAADVADEDIPTLEDFAVAEAPAVIDTAAPVEAAAIELPELGELEPLELPAMDEAAFSEPPAEPAPQAEASPAAVAPHVEVAAPAPVASPAPAAPASPAPAEEEAAGIRDELDDQLLPIFFEEAEELGASIGGVLRDMRANLDDASQVQAVARLLHTLKGSARMAGAMRLGAYVHSLESHLQGMTEDRPATEALVDDLENGLDHIGNLIEALRNPGSAQALVAPAVQAGAAASAAEITATAGAVPDAVKPTAAKPALPTPLEEIDGIQGQRAPLRVRAELVDRFVNEAGEVSIARTRIEGELRTLRRSMLDLTENVIRLRNQLREVEIQAESQMQSRIAAAESQHSDFDPLEFDRFTRLQELTRMMAESVGDVTTIQQNLLRNLDAADAALHAQGRLSRDLQQALMSVRMVPFEELADRLYRIVRQTSKELGKRVNLDIQGGSIEIDRGVLDRMTAPIEHLLRNAIAHGIEKPEERLASGKPEFGQVTLKLNQLSNEIALELSDDGRGLDFGRIAARGRKAGLISADEQPNENRLTQLIFEPGFSTAESVSGVAGRGVGMDVVKNETLSVGGRIDTSSTPNQGTRFVIHLPLTLAITQALLVRAGDRTYAVPSNMVEQALELKEQALDEVRTRGYIEWNNAQYPFTYLPRLLGDTQSRPTASRFNWLLLTRAGSQTLAVHIDELRGNQEIVVKNAGPQFVRLQGFSGATVLPDGEISLILNPVALAARRITTAASAARQADEIDAVPDLPMVETRIPTIMVVDDSLTVRKITSRLLEREGFQVVTAKDGVDALEQLVDMKPDVMLLDIEMPRMDGFDLARNVRADERLRDIPIIMITSRMADKHRNYAKEIGVNHYLGKPYQEEQLLELIAGFIAQQR